MQEKYFPSICGFSLQNYKIIEDSLFQIHVRGDIYYKDKCIGYYDPVYIVDPKMPPQLFIRVDAEVNDKYKYYYSIFDYAGFGQKTVDGVSITPHGFSVLLSDLEYLIRLYDFMENKISSNQDYDAHNLIGVINNNTIAPIQFKKPVDMDRNALIDFIKEKIPQIKLDENYPIRIFRNRSDFVFHSISVAAEQGTVINYGDEV